MLPCFQKLIVKQNFPLLVHELLSTMSCKCSSWCTASCRLTWSKLLERIWKLQVYKNWMNNNNNENHMNPLPWWNRRHVHTGDLLAYSIGTLNHCQKKDTTATAWHLQRPSGVWGQMRTLEQLWLVEDCSQVRSGSFVILDVHWEMQVSYTAHLGCGWWLVVLVVVARLKKWKASNGKRACLLRCPKKWVAWVSRVRPKKVINRGRCRPSQFQSSLSQRHHHLQNSDFPPTLLALSFQNFIRISLQLRTISHSKRQLTVFTQIAAREYQERRK